MKFKVSKFFCISLLLTPLAADAQNLMSTDVSTVSQSSMDARNVVSYMSVYTTSTGTIPGDSLIPLTKLAFPVQGTDIVASGEGTFFLQTQGFYEITYGVSSLSGGRFAVMIYPGSAIPGYIAQSKMTLDASTSRRMATTSFIYYNVSPSIPTQIGLIGYGAENFTLDAISGDVAATMTIKKLA